MKKNFRMIFCFATLVLATPKLHAAVSDQAGFFSAEAVQQANQKISVLQNKYKKDVLIETFQTVPTEKRGDYSPARKNQFFANWLRERAQAAGVNGIHILITRDPSHLQVGVAGKAAQQGFGPDDRDRVRDSMLQHFRKKEYDQGLRAALDTIATDFEEHSKTFSAAAGGTSDRPIDTGYRRTPAPAPQSTGFGWFTWLLLIGGGLLLVRALRNRARPAYNAPDASNRTNAPGAPPDQGYGGGLGGQGGGGGFGRGMMGGIFGGLAGSWLGSRLFGQNGEAQAREAPPSAQAQENSEELRSSGGDFDTEDAGADSDSDDSGDGGGGGDF